MNIIFLWLFIVFFCAVRATAYSTYLEAFSSYYFTTGTRLESCLVCHQGSNPTTGPPQSLRNPYGLDFASQPRLARGAIEAAFANIEGLDSDGDGFKNISEIDSLTFPGNANDFPATGPSITQQP